MWQKLILFLLIITGLQVAAQQQAEGIVRSKSDKQSLPFVNIIGLQSGGVGTSTDLEGKFRIELPAHETQLVFSTVGFKQDTIKIQAGFMEIFLQEEIADLDEVVVTALGIKREKKSLATP